MARFVLAALVFCLACGDDDGLSCPSGLTRCGGGCVDLQNDDSNCGACGAVCGDASCSGGMCVGGCPEGWSVCGVMCCEFGCMAGGGCAGDVDGGPDDAAMTTDAAIPVCPTDPPTDASPCTDPGLTCTWVECPGDGVTAARCESEAWTIATSACVETTCSDGRLTCEVGQLCVERVGGAFLIECAENPCGEDAVQPLCACEVCGGADCTVTDLTVRCDSCPSGLCP